MANFSIVWTKVDEAPALATYALLPVVNAYTKASQYKDLSAESSFKLQKTGGNILAMVN